MRKPTPVKPKFWLLRVLIGLGLVALFAYSFSEWRAFEAIAVHVQGKVLSVKHETKATGRRGNRITIERPYVQFTVPGSDREVTTTAKVMTRTSFDVGSVLDLEFDPKSPEETVRVTSGLSILDWSVGVVGLALIVFAIGAQLRYRREVAAATPSPAPVTPPHAI